MEFSTFVYLVREMGGCCWSEIRRMVEVACVSVRRDATSAFACGWRDRAAAG